MSIIRNRRSDRSVRATGRRAPIRMTVVTALVLALLVPAGLAGSGVVAAPAAAAPGDSFAADAPTVFISQQQEPTKLFKAVQQGNDIDFVLQGSTSNATYNAIGYRKADDFIYGIRQGGATSTQAQNRHLLRIGQGGHVTDLGEVVGLPNLPGNASWNAATFGEGAEADTFFLRPSINTSHALMRNLWKFDITARIVTTIPLVDSANASVMVPNTSDIIFKDGYVWGFDAGSERAYRIDPATGVTHSWPFQIAGSAFGGQWVYGNGNVGISNNANGKVWQFAIVNPTSNTPSFRLISRQDGPQSTLNDGTSKQGVVDLGVEKSAPAVALGGSMFQFTLKVTNHSTTPSSGFVLNDVVPAGLTNVSTSTPGCTLAGNSVSCVGDALGAGDSTTVTINATMPAGSTECVTNTGTVLGNELDPVPGNDSDSATVCPGQPGLSLFKMSDATEDTRQGDTVHYTLYITNTGGGNYSAANPAVVTDDLSEVLDDADYNNDALFSGGAGTLSYASPRLSWSGPLAAGEWLTITYSVTLKNTGDGKVRNVVFEGSGTTPACDPPVGPNWHDAATGVPCYEVEFELPRLTITKTANLASLPSGYSDITYTVKVKNEGPGDTSDDAPASMSDDLAQLAPEATLKSGTIATDVGSASMTGSVLNWSGNLAAGATATITFTVEYTSALDFDGVLTNTACVPAKLTLPGADRCATATLKSHITAQWKEVTASSDPIVTGTVLSYTLHFENQGATPFVVDVVDDLNDVLDDTSLITGPVATGALTATYSAATKRISVSGSLTTGQSATVSYTVAVKAEAQRGNNRAVNFLIAPGDTPPPTCVPAADLPDCTDTPLPGSLLWQKLDDHYTPLAGSEWSLTPVDAGGAPTGSPISVVDCVQAAAASCTGADKDPAAGAFKVVGLGYGHYRLTETKAPAGYLLDAGLIPLLSLTAAVLDAGQFLNFQQTVPEIPLTGGLGEDGFRIAALLAFAFMTGFVFWRIRRRRS